MRPFSALSLAVVVVVAFCLSAGALAGTVAIGKPIIIWSTSDQLERSCAALRPVSACTILRDALLTCECFRSGGVWQRHARVSAIPVVFIAQSTYLVHEMTHVADFRAMLGEYVRAVESRTFSSAPECEASAGRVLAGFGDEIVAVRDESARRRDGMQIADAAGPARAVVVDEQVTVRSDTPDADESLRQNAEAAGSAMAAVSGVPLEMFAP